MALTPFVRVDRVVIQLKDLHKGIDLFLHLLADAFYHRFRHISGTAGIRPINDPDTLDCILKLAVDADDALDQAKQVTSLEVFTTTRVDRAGTAIVACMQANNLKMALFFHGERRRAKGRG